MASTSSTLRRSSSAASTCPNAARICASAVSTATGSSWRRAPRCIRSTSTRKALQAASALGRRQRMWAESANAQTGVASERNGMRAALGSDLFEDHGSMIANRLLADTKPLRDLVVIQALRDAVQHFPLAWRQFEKQ